MATYAIDDEIGEVGVEVDRKLSRPSLELRE
jgi:hypothetical protein